MNALEKIRQRFAHEPRPAHFTSHCHCCECAEHNDILTQYDNTNPPYEVVQSAAWEPVAFMTPEAFRYYFPRLCELAYGTGQAFYLDDFLMHLEIRRDLFRGEEKEMILELLLDLVEILSDEIDRCATRPALDRVSEAIST